MSTATLATMPTTWAELDREVTVAGVAVTIGHNTTAMRSLTEDPDAFGIRLHGHLIAIIYPDGAFIRDCNHVTKTTYDRLKRFVAPFGATLYRRRGSGLLVTRDDRTLAVGGNNWTLVRA
jgi:hypothetical protein